MRTFEELARKYLNPPEYERFRVNIGTKINQIPYNESSFIDKAFIWKHKPEGDYYWMHINERCYREIMGQEYFIRR